MTAVVIAQEEVFIVKHSHYREDDYPEHKVVLMEEHPEYCECPMCPVESPKAITE